MQIQDDNNDNNGGIDRKKMVLESLKKGRDRVEELHLGDRLKNVKRRVRKFYDDHQTGCNFGSITTGIVALVGIAGLTWYSLTSCVDEERLAGKKQEKEPTEEIVPRERYEKLQREIAVAESLRIAREKEVADSMAVVLDNTVGGYKNQLAIEQANREAAEAKAGRYESNANLVPGLQGKVKNLESALEDAYEPVVRKFDVSLDTSRVASEGFALLALSANYSDEAEDWKDRNSALKGFEDKYPGLLKHLRLKKVPIGDVDLNVEVREIDGDYITNVSGEGYSLHDEDYIHPSAMVEREE